MRDRHHFLAKRLAVAPGNIAVNKRERIDSPKAIFLNFRLVGAKHPMAGLVHFQDDRAAGRRDCRKPAQRLRERLGGRQVCAAEFRDFVHRSGFLYEFAKSGAQLNADLQRRRARIILGCQRVA